MYEQLTDCTDGGRSGGKKASTPRQVESGGKKRVLVKNLNWEFSGSPCNVNVAIAKGCDYAWPYPQILFRSLNL